MENSPQLATPTPEDPIETLTGSALQRLGTALVAVAKRPSRAAYATWMRVVEPGWILPMLGMNLAFGVLNGVIEALVDKYLRAPATHTVYYRFGVPSFADRIIYALAIAPLFGLIVFVSLIFLIASLMSAERGTLKERAFQVARPYLLAEIIIGLVLLFINQPITILGLTPVGQNPLVILITLPINLAILIYYLASLLNALAAGSDRSRWLLFGVWLLISLITVFVVPYGAGALLYHVGIHVAVPF